MHIKMNACAQQHILDLPVKHASREGLLGDPLKLYTTVSTDNINELQLLNYTKGLSRGHATYIDIEILGVTKNRFLA